MMSDASDMLAAALEQMDGIIAGKGLLQYLASYFNMNCSMQVFELWFLF